jgi:hypothetical protein
MLLSSGNLSPAQPGRAFSDVMLRIAAILLALAVGYDLLMLDGKYIAKGSFPRRLMWPERQCRKSHRFAAYHAFR